MITIRSQPGRIEVTGHAYYAPRGFDVVCAAVSTLVQTLAESLGDPAGDGVTWELQPGKAVFQYRDLSAREKLLIDSFFVGVKGVAGAYPDRVEIIWPGGTTAPQVDKSAGLQLNGGTFYDVQK